MSSALFSLQNKTILLTGGAGLYGRGLAAMLAQTGATLILAARDVTKLQVVADEETDSALGTGWITQYGKLRADYAVVGEGGEGNAICCGHNGVVWLNVQIHGKAAHGSLPTKGINALEKMSALVLALSGYKRQLARRTFRAPNGERLHPTINIGGVFSAGEGGKINTVPATASFTIDRRVLPNENVGAAERELTTFLKMAAKKISRF
jgi:succinyl-diaminopimelate desuccinylase